MTPSYIVDAHHHLWDLGAVEYPWLQQRGVRRFFGDPTPIQRDYDVADFRGDHGSVPVRKSVHIQVGTAEGSELDETQWLDGRAEISGLPSGIVAYCDLSSTRASEVIQKHLQCSRRVRGIRQIFSRHPDEDAADGAPQLLAHPVVTENLKLLSSRALSFDLQLTPPHMTAAARLFEQIDGLQTALCHAGSPWRRDPSGLGEWRAGLKVLAEIPGMTCKLSGLGMFDHRWTSDTLKSIVLTALEAFGPDRVMWGSNFPVDKLYHSYSKMFGALIGIVPREMHERVFRANAERFYRI